MKRVCATHLKLKIHSLCLSRRCFLVSYCEAAVKRENCVLYAILTTSPFETAPHISFNPNFQMKFCTEQGLWILSHQQPPGTEKLKKQKNSAIDWRLFQWVLRFLPYDSWDKLQSPSDPELDKQEKMD